MTSTASRRGWDLLFPATADCAPAASHRRLKTTAPHLLFAILFDPQTANAAIVSHAAIRLELKEGRSAPLLGSNVHAPRQDRGKGVRPKRITPFSEAWVLSIQPVVPVAIRVRAPRWGRWVNAIIKHMKEKLRNASLPSGQRPSLTVPSGPIGSGRAMRERACA
jgi:hypothetical protein